MKSELKYVDRIQCQTHTKESKKHIYTQIRGGDGSFLRQEELK